MNSCFKATEQMSQGLDRPLTRMEKVQLKLHLMMCKNCSRCSEQLSQLHRIAQKRGGDADSNT